MITSETLVLIAGAVDAGSVRFDTVRTEFGERLKAGDPPAWHAFRAALGIDVARFLGSLNEPLGHKRHGRPLLDSGKRRPAFRMEQLLLRRNTILRGHQELREEQVRATQLPQRGHGLRRDARGVAGAILEELRDLERVNGITFLLAGLRATQMLDLHGGHRCRGQAETRSSTASTYLGSNEFLPGDRPRGNLLCPRSGRHQ